MEDRIPGLGRPWLASVSLKEGIMEIVIEQGQFLCDMHGLNIESLRENSPIPGYTVYETIGVNADNAADLAEGLLNCINVRSMSLHGGNGRIAHNKHLYIVHADKSTGKVVATYHYDGCYLGIVTFRRITDEPTIPAAA